MLIPQLVIERRYSSAKSLYRTRLRCFDYLLEGLVVFHQGGLGGHDGLLAALALDRGREVFTPGKCWQLKGEGRRIGVEVAELPEWLSSAMSIELNHFGRARHVQYYLYYYRAARRGRECN